MNFNRVVTLSILATSLMLLVTSCAKSHTCDAVYNYKIRNLTDRTIVMDYEYIRVILGEDSGPVHTFCGNKQIHSWYYKDTVLCDNIQIHASSRNNPYFRFCIPPQTDSINLFSCEEEIRVGADRKCSTLYSVTFAGLVFYNIDDTASVEVSHSYTDKDPSLIALFERHNLSETIGDSVIWTYNISITDSLLEHMKKDTSMLRLFPEHYSSR